MKILDGTEELFDGEIYYRWGWLEGAPAKATWSESEKKKFLDTLELVHGKNEIRQAKGFHVCAMCETITGSAEIHIKYKGKIYAAPNGVVHYIKMHDYQPPAIVVEAVMNGDSISRKIKWEGM